MAAVGAEVAGSWFLLSGVVSFFILLLLLSIFLTALCSECSRRSFELPESEVDKSPSTLIRVVKLEELARENPMINEIQSDEKEFNPDEGNFSFSTWRSHLGVSSHQDVQTNGSAAVMKTGSDPDAVGESNPEVDNAVVFTPWRSHLKEPQITDLKGFSPVDSAHIYHTIGGRRSSGDASSQPTNHEPGDEGGAADLSNRDRNSVYAQVSKKVRPPTPEVQVQVQEDEEESSPPLPDRKAALDDDDDEGLKDKS